MCRMHLVIIQQKLALSKSNMPFDPRIPNQNIVPIMRPSYHKQAQGGVVKNMHSIIFNTGRYALAGIGPVCEQFSCRGVTHDYGE
jgi:hypothetical protein